MVFYEIEGREIPIVSKEEAEKRRAIPTVNTRQGSVAVRNAIQRHVHDELLATLEQGGGIQIWRV